MLEETFSHNVLQSLSLYSLAPLCVCVFSFVRTCFHFQVKAFGYVGFGGVVIY